LDDTKVFSLDARRVESGAARLFGRAAIEVVKRSIPVIEDLKTAL
jgi:hypothetical protein